MFLLHDMLANIALPTIQAELAPRLRVLRSSGRSQSRSCRRTASPRSHSRRVHGFPSCRADCTRPAPDQRQKRISLQCLT